MNSTHRNPVRIAVIGCGNFGKHHAHCLGSLPNVELVGVCDHMPRRAQALARARGVGWARRVSELVGEPEAVCVVVPPSEHAAVVDECLSLGLHVLVEKPFGVDPVAVAALEFKARTLGRILQVGYLERFHDAVRTITALVSCPTQIRCTRISPETAIPDTTGDAPHIVLDLMSHDIDHVLRLMGGEPTSVTAMAPNSQDRSNQLTIAFLRFHGGAGAVLVAGRQGTQRRRELQLFDGREWTSADLIAGTVRWQGTVLHRGADNPLKQQLASFADAVRGFGAPRMQAGEAGQVLDTALAIMCQVPRSQAPRLRVDHDDPGRVVPAEQLGVAR